jgi:hypothetical protein
MRLEGRKITVVKGYTSRYQLVMQLQLVSLALPRADPFVVTFFSLHLATFHISRI